MKIGRRVLFFAAIAAICITLAPVVPSEFRWLSEWMAGLSAFWAIAIGIEDVVHVRELRRREAARD